MPSHTLLPGLVCALFLLPPPSQSLPSFGVEWVSWPESVCNTLPFAYSSSWTARDGTPAPLDSPGGWPTSDAYTVVFDYVPTSIDPLAFVPPSVYGVYRVTWDGKGDVALFPGIGRLLNTTFDEPSWTTEAYVALERNDTNPTPGLVIGVFESVRSPGGAVNSGFSNLVLYQPSCAGSSPSTFYAPAAIDAVRPFDHARVHEWHGTNFIPVDYPATVSWGERRTLGDPFWGTSAGGKPNAVGTPWETSLLLSHEAGNLSIWINAPVYADDAYIAALAELWVVGNTTLGIPGCSAPYLYIEHGNELWLNESDSPKNYLYNKEAAVAEVGAGGSVLNNDGETDPEAWARRRHAKRLREIAATFKAAFARSSSSPTVVRAVFAWMQDYSENSRTTLQWFERTYGAGEAAKVFYSYAVNSYHGAGVYPSGTPPLKDFALPNDVLESLLATSDASLPARNASAVLAKEFGLALMTYEGSGWVEPDGKGFNSQGFNATLASIVTFNRGEGAAEQQRYDIEVVWGQLELTSYNFYALSGPYGPSYGVCFGLAEDVINATSSPKYAGAMELIRRRARENNKHANM